MFAIFGQFLIVCLILIQRGSSEPSQKDDISRHPDIVRYAKSAEIRNYMDQSIDPCENFYNFACGNYYRINPPNEHPYQANVFLTFSKSLSRKLSKLLTDDDNAMDNAIDKKVKDFYESCMNLPTLEYKYTAKLKEIIGEFGQMPALEGDKWQECEFDWLKTVAEIAYKYNIRIIVGHLIEVDSANNTINRMHILPQTNPLGNPAIYRNDAYKDIRRNKKRSRVEKLVYFLGLDAKLAEQTIDEIFEFETYLFAGKESETEREYDDGDEDNTTWNNYLISIEEMQNIYYPHLDIKRLIRISFGSLPTQPVYNLLLQDDHLATVLKETPKRVVANYIFFHLLEMLNMFEYDHEDQTGLHDFCIEKTKFHLGKVINNRIYHKYTSKQTELDVQHMFQTIKSAFSNVLQSDRLTWMAEDTRKYALEKLRTIRMEINSYEQTNFTEEFGPLTIDHRDYIENLKSIFSLNALKSRQILNEPPKPYENSKLAFTPSYVLVENLIRVPVSIIQPYYLWSDLYPNALKFATLGFLMSHELIHGFDSEGRNYDKFGNEHQWWDKESSQYFIEQTKCFKNQYCQYKYDGRLLPEPKTQAENIADNGGVRLAYDAYVQWYTEAMRTHQNMDLEVMPRLNYTSKQLFFISYGQLWCNAVRPELRYYLVSKDDHAPGEIRVIGTMSNLEEFSKEFNCPKGSTMNPADKCIIY